MEEWLLIGSLLLLVIVYLYGVKRCFDHMQTKQVFRYFDASLWMCIIVFGNVFGMLAYYMLEGKE